MQDRIPVNPGRVLITPENGSPAYYANMVRADNPTQEGTPLNKASLLRDSTAERFGFNSSVVPDDILAYLGKYNQHWWKCDGSGYAISLSTAKSVQLYLIYTEAEPLLYAESAYADGSGSVVLANTNTVEVGWSSPASTYSVLKGKYIEAKDKKIYYCPIDTTFSLSTQGEARAVSAVVNEVSVVSSGSGASAFFVQDNNRDAYPNSGVQNGLTYHYLGIPLQNAATAPIMATGTYKGTGTTGSSNKNTLTFDFVPKIVFIVAKTASMFHGYETTLQEWIILVNGMTKTLTKQASNNSGTGAMTISWSDKTVSWYASWAGGQLNTSGVEYLYVAFG